MNTSLDAMGRAGRFTNRWARRLGPPALVVSCALGVGGCADDDLASSSENDFTSAVATLLDFEFSGELVTTSSVNPANKVRAQLIYTVGHFNQERGVSRLNAVELSDVQTTPIGGGLYRVRYHAKLPVAWGSKDNLPSHYTLTLPKRVDDAGQATFQSLYGADCTDHLGHTLTSTNFWYYYRPDASGCRFADGDVTVSVASVTKSELNSVNAYPEYHRIWEDGVLDVVAVFGKNDGSSTSNSDAGIAAYNEFVDEVRSRFPKAATTPLELPIDPGNAVRDITFDIETEAGRVSIVVLLVDEVASAPASFDARFQEATPRADLIFYGGHAGLGKNVRALSNKARFFPGKYQIMFLNGCDTFAYEDDSLVETRAALNPSDPSASKYLDVLRNAMPAYFHRLAPAAMALIDAAVAADHPRSYEEILATIDPAQVVLVTGDEDNEFTPELVLEPSWGGVSESGSVGYKQSESYVTEVLPAGDYVFELTPEPSAPGGDADLFVGIGDAPATTSAFKCQSYRYNSNERCFVTLTEPEAVYLTTKGDKSGASAYQLRAWTSLR